MRILVIEDDKNIAKLLKANLESELFVVDVVDNGDQGVFQALTNDYDLITLDMVLPKKNGLQVCQEIRKEKKSVPIIIISVKGDIPTKVEMLKCQADDYLTKPFSFDELLARINALLRRPKQIDDHIFKIDDLLLDCLRHNVTRGGKNIYLTRKEFMLLKYMLENRGIVLSRGMIMEHVWDINANPFSNTIESHMLSLRKKIDQKGKIKLIHTVPGRGYKLDLYR